MDKRKGSLRAFLLQPISPHHLDLALLSFCFVTGLLDCSVFINYSAFVGMQTGNTVLLCLSTAGLPRDQPYSYAATLVSLVSFLLGAAATFWASTWAGKLRRLTVAVNLFLQGLFIAIAAALVSGNVVPTADNGNRAVLLSAVYVGQIPLLAFQSGAQIATSRLLGYNEIPVNVLTSTYADLAGDPRLLAPKDNVKRNRRVAAVVGVMGGAFCAAWIEKKGPGLQLALWIGAAIKISVSVIAFVFMEPAEEAHSVPVLAEVDHIGDSSDKNLSGVPRSDGYQTG